MLYALPAVLSVPALIGAGAAASPHCGIMCAPLQAMHLRQRGAMPLHWAMLWLHLGRLAGYAALGALAGWLGGGLIPLLPPAIAGIWLRLIAGGAMVYSGVSLLRQDQHSCAVHKLHAPRGVPSFAMPFALGLSWALAPCGLLYALLFLAGTSGSAASGGFLTAAFALGSTPALFLSGAVSMLLQRMHRRLRVIGGCALVAIGLASAVIAVHEISATAGGWCASPESRLRA